MKLQTRNRLKTIQIIGKVHQLYYSSFECR